MAKSEELDLRDVVRIIWFRKFFVLNFVFSFVFIGAIVCFFSTKTYEGNALMEMGEVARFNPVSKSVIFESLDQSNELLEIAQTLFKRENLSLKIELPRGSSRLIRIVGQSPDKQLISTSIARAIQIIGDRHKEKADFYIKNGLNVQPTRLIDSARISETPVKPRFQQVLAGMTLLGFLVGLFIVFFQEFIRTEKN